jgi:intracellular sulfur oxidation DsrE/DsrF family protein
MTDRRSVSREQRNALVDGQLEARESARIAALAAVDAALRKDLEELEAVKRQIRHAYADLRPPRASRPPQSAARWRALAAGLALAAAGWFGHALWERALPPAEPVARSLQPAWTSAEKVLVHVSSEDHGVLSRALREIEDLLRSAQASGRPVQVEIVASDLGLILLSAAAAPAAQRLAEMRRSYGNLKLVACGESLERLRAAGRPVELVPGTSIAPSALEEVAARLRDGWVYVRT